MAAIPRILLVDDDPLHLEIYGKIVEKAGYQSVPVLVRFSGPDAFPDTAIQLAMLDYRLNSVKTAPEIARDIKEKFPGIPIILLTDLLWPPADVAPLVDLTVRKGEPDRLIEVLRAHLSQA